MKSFRLCVDGQYVACSSRLQQFLSATSAGVSSEDLEQLLLEMGLSSTLEYGAQQICEALLCKSELYLALQDDDLWHLKFKRNETIRGRATIRWQKTLCSPALVVRISRIFAPYFMFNSGFIAILAMCCAIFGYGTYQAAHSIAHLSATNDLGAALVATFVLALGMFSHEVGHCAAAISVGTTVGRIGCGFYCGMPVLFADVSSCWTLPSRERVLVDIAGGVAQIIFTAMLSCTLFLVHHEWLEEGIRWGILANGSIVLVSLNPLLKYDGFWVVSDLLNVNNLKRESVLAVAKIYTNLFQSVSVRRPLDLNSRDFIVAAYIVMSTSLAMWYIMFSAILFSSHCHTLIGFKLQLHMLNQFTTNPKATVSAAGMIVEHIVAIIVIPISTLACARHIHIMINEIIQNVRMSAIGSSMI